MGTSTTNRDIEYLKSVFKKNGHKKPVGPSQVAKDLDVSRAGSLKKLKRLAKQGFGEYINSRGLILNKQGIKRIKDEMERHHIVEDFFLNSLDIELEVSCEESKKIAPLLSKEVLEEAKKMSSYERDYDCEFNPKKEMKTKNMRKCHWLKSEGLKEV